MIKSDNRLEICKRTRKIASDALYETLETLLKENKPISEVRLRDIWLKNMRRNKSIFLDGWYDPPPHGIGVLFGSASGNSRCNYKTLRSDNIWPKDRVFLKDENELAYLFASPVNQSSGIIGDFGLTIYLGDNKTVQEHIQKCLKINYEIFEYIQTGMAFSEIYEFAEELFKRYKVINEVSSTTDLTGKDLGHTIPCSHKDWSEEELKILHGNDWRMITNMISKERIFVNSVEKTTYQNYMAITLEPRLTVIDNPEIPIVSFHTIILIDGNGNKELLTNFDEIFRLVGMDYVID